MKGNWQTIGMLIVAAVLTFLVVGWMNSTVNARRRQELSYNEFVKMVDEGKVESISVGNSGRFPCTPRRGTPTIPSRLSTTWCGWRGTTSLWTVFWKMMWSRSGR